MGSVRITLPCPRWNNKVMGWRERNLGSDNAGKSIFTCRLGKLNRTRQSIVICNSQRIQFQLAGARHEVSGHRSTVKEAIGRVCVELGVGNSAHQL